MNNRYYYEYYFVDTHKTTDFLLSFRGGMLFGMLDGERY